MRPRCAGPPATYYERGTRPPSATSSSRGTFLREEALRHWQDFVGADEMTRFFSQGIGAVRGAIASILRPPRAPVAEVREATTDDLPPSPGSRRPRLPAGPPRPGPRTVPSRGRRRRSRAVGPDGRLRRRASAPGSRTGSSSIGTDIAETGAGEAAAGPRRVDRGQRPGHRGHARDVPAHGRSDRAPRSGSPPRRRSSTRSCSPRCSAKRRWSS